MKEFRVLISIEEIENTTLCSCGKSDCDVDKDPFEVLTPRILETFDTLKEARTKVEEILGKGLYE